MEGNLEKRNIFLYKAEYKYLSDGLKILRKIMKNYFRCHMLLSNTCWDNASTIIKLLIIWRCSNRRTNIIYIAKNNSVETVKEQIPF